MTKIYCIENFFEMEKVVFFKDNSEHLKGIIAIDSTALGPAMGGCRIYTYSSDLEALQEVTRLAKTMTLKNALFGLPYGGGKAIIFNSCPTDRKETLSIFADVLNQLGGIYYTTDDINTSVFDNEFIKRTSPYVKGFSYKNEPIPATAYGVYQAIKATVQHYLHKDSLKNVKIGIQGLGKVGFKLCEFLYNENAKLYVTDIKPELVRDAEKRFQAIAVEPTQITSAEVDILSPCALENCIDENNINRLKASYIVGGANNPLSSKQLVFDLHKKGVVYIPDFLANAGGVIDIHCEGELYSHHFVLKTVRGYIFNKTLEVLSLSDDIGEVPLVVAEQEANNRILKQKNIKVP